MGQLVVQELVTADGFAANTNNEFTAYELIQGGTAEFDQSQLAWLETVEFWPTPASEGEIIAPALNGLRRYVFSRQLQNAPWGGFPAGQDPTLLALLSAKTYDAGLIELEYSLSACW